MLDRAVFKIFPISVKRGAELKFYLLLFARLALLALFLLTLASFFGRWYWLPELASHFVLQYFLLAAFFTFFFSLFNKAFSVWTSFGLLLLHFYYLLPFYIGDWDKPSAPAHFREITLVQFNIHGFRNDTPEAVMAWLAENAQKFDIVQLQEVPDEFAVYFDEIKDRYPHQFFKPAQPETWKVSGLAILSRIPLGEVEDVPISGGDNFYVRVPLQDFRAVLYGVHAYNPIRKDHAAERNRQILRVARAVGADSTPYRILMGDLNLTPYSFWHKKLEDLSGLQNSLSGKAVQNSFPAYASSLPWMRYILGIPIDHVLISRGVFVKKRTIGPAWGSDHYPVITTLLLP